MIDAVRRLCSHAIIVGSPAYRPTTTLDSYKLGATGVRGNCLFVHADISFELTSIKAFF